MHPGIELLRSNRGFLKLWLASTQSQLGSLLNFVALSLFVFDKTHSGTAVGMLEISLAVPSVFVGLFAGIIVDRYNTKWVMVISDLIRALLFLCLGFVSFLPVIYSIVFCSSLVGLFFAPARTSTMPLIINKDSLMEANSLFSLNSQAVRIVGPAIAGLAYIHLGFKLICIFNAVTFLVSSLMILTLQMPVLHREKKSLKDVRGIISDVREGFQYIRSTRFIKWVLLVQGGLQLGAGAIVVLVVMFVKDALNGSDAVYGMIISATAIGSVLGAVLTWYSGKLNHSTVLRISLLLLGVSVLLIAFSTQVWIALLLFGIVGISQTTLSISISTLLQKNVDHKVMGRTFSTMGTMISICQLASMGIGGVLADVIGVRAVYVAGSVVILTMTILASIHMKEPIEAIENASVKG